VLEKAGLVRKGRKAQWRPCRLEASKLRDAAAWVERFRANWEERLEQHDGYLAELQRADDDHDDE
jgi:hypothetical protein